MSIPIYFTLVSLVLLHSTMVTGQTPTAVVGFDQTVYMAVEGSTDDLEVEVCVSLLSGQLVESFVISMTTQSGTAMGKCLCVR